MMANFIIRERIKKPEDLKQFDVAGYKFDTETEGTLTFLRKEQ